MASVSTRFGLPAAGFQNVDASGRHGEYGLYLDAMALVLRDDKHRGFAALDVRPGHRILDVGCGTGSDACDLAQLAAPGGQVVGVDASTELVGEARRRAVAADLGVEFYVTDAHHLPFAAASFDCARADRVFQHLTDPRRALAEMVRVVRPGASIGLTDPDWGALAVDAPDVATTRAIVDFFCHSTIRHGWSGRRLAGLCKEAGLLDVNVEARPIMLHALGPFVVMVGLSTILTQVVEARVVSAEAARIWLASLETADQEGRFLACNFIWQVTARKPSP